MASRLQVVCGPAAVSSSRSGLLELLRQEGALSAVQEEGGARQFLYRQRSREGRRQASLDPEARVGAYARGASLSRRCALGDGIGTADKWFVSLSVELEDEPERCESRAAVGVDLGVHRFASLATLTGEATIQGPKPLRCELKKLRRLARRLSRKRKGSKNREKARLKLARLHYRIRCIRQDSLHKIPCTRFLAQAHDLLDEELRLDWHRGSERQRHACERAVGSSDLGHGVP